MSKCTDVHINEVPAVGQSNVGVVRIIFHDAAGAVSHLSLDACFVEGVPVVNLYSISDNIDVHVSQKLYKGLDEL